MFWLQPATPPQGPRPKNRCSHPRRLPRRRRGRKGERQLVLQPVRRVRIRREMMAECDKVGNTGFDDRLGALVIVMAPPVSAHRTPAGSPPATRTSAPRCSQTQCYILAHGLIEIGSSLNGAMVSRVM